MEHYSGKLLKTDGLVLPILAGLTQKKDGFYEDMPAEEYHSQYDRMSNSFMKYLGKSPLHFLQKVFDAQKGEKENEPDHFRFGRAFHMAILEPSKFKECFIAMPDFGNPRTKAAREEKEKFISSQKEGAILLDQKEIDSLTGMCEAISSNIYLRPMLKDMKPEGTILFSEIESKIACRARPDLISSTGYMFDIKTSREISPGMFANDIAKYGYHVQLAFYREAYLMEFGKEPEMTGIVAIEKTPPYDIAIYFPNDNDLSAGREWFRAALRTYRKCVETGKWPGQSPEPMIINMPRWAEMNTFPTWEF